MKLEFLQSRTTISLLLLLLITIPSTSTASEDSREQFFNSLAALCGARYEGEMTFPQDGQDSFAGKLLVAEIASCNDSEIRVPFSVGDDTSRTWLFKKIDGGLQLKHDHRHADGSPDEITMYGGMASDGGSAKTQSFAADQHTAELIPAAATNIWTVRFSEDADQLTYHLERHAKPRFTAVLKRVDSE